MALRCLSGIFLITVLSVSSAAFAGYTTLVNRATPDLGATLSKYQGKVAKLKLCSGHALEGKISSVDDATVLISDLSDQPLFDAVVKVSDVCAVIVKAREE